MPFENCGARVYKVAAVQRDAPAASGVYGLSNAREWIYIAETGNIQASLLEHLADDERFGTSRLVIR